MIIYNSRCDLELERLNGTTININHKNNINFEDKKVLLKFLISSIFLSVFIYYLPFSNENSISLDRVMHQILIVFPVLVALFMIIYNIRIKGFKYEK